MYHIKLTPYACFFYREWLLDPHSTRYNIPLDQLLYGALDKEKLQSALYRYISEYLLLNSHVEVSRDVPYWVPNECVHAMSYEESTPKESDVLTYIKAPFDVHAGPLYRMKLIALSPGVYRFIVVLHHLLVDGSSLDEGVFITLSKYYNDLDDVAPLSRDAQIKALVNLEKQLSAVLEGSHASHCHFWQSQLSSVEAIQLDFLQKSTRVQTFEENDNHVAEIKFTYPEHGIKHLAFAKKQYELSTYTYGLSVFALLLYRYTGQARFAISFPIAIQEGSSFVFGSQINVNLIPYAFDQLSTIEELVYHTVRFFKLIKNRDTAYAYYPIEKIIQGHSNHLLNVSYVKTSLRRSSFDFKDIQRVKKISAFHVDGVTQNMLLFEQEMLGEYLHYCVRYDKRSLDSDLVQRFVAVYQHLFFEVVETLVQSPSRHLSTYCVITPKDYDNLVGKHKVWLQSRSAAPLLHQRFELQAQKHPHRMAVTTSNQRLTYQVINQSANQLARYLLCCTPKQNSPYVIICMDKDDKLITTILSVLKLGYAYVPIDPKQADERVSYILKDVQAEWIITQQCYVDRLSKWGSSHIINLDKLGESNVLDHFSTDNLSEYKITRKGLAYVIYTSGTTGKPKGVLQTHDNVLTLFDSVTPIYSFNEQDRWLLLHAPHFDFSVWEMWGALLYGAQLVIPTYEKTMNISLLCQLCMDERITVLNQTPQVFYQLSQYIVQESLQNRLFDHLRYIILGGERLDFFQLKGWFSGYDHALTRRPKLINMYGITETTIHASYKEVMPDEINQQSIIGQALPHQKLYILNDTREVVPVGVIGELYVGGYGLACGYINHPALTSKRFLNNPFQTKEEAKHRVNNRLYKTGDLARRLPRGDIVYMGRCDSQVKIRGFRIELGDIRSHLLLHPCIQGAVVTTKRRLVHQKEVDERIIAYYVADSPLNMQELTVYMQDRVPHYMCPDLYIYLQKIPLTPNGKVNYKALPFPYFKKQIVWEKPKNTVEQRICHAFSLVLNHAPIGILDDFFQLGGDSLKAIQLVGLLQHYFAIDVLQIFKARTPQNLSNMVQQQSISFREKMNTIKSFYQTKPLPPTLADIVKQQSYFDTIKVRHVTEGTKENKRAQDILLTGATGYLGSYLLDTLLQETSHRIYMLIRALSDEHALERLEEKYVYYFGKSIRPWVKQRIVVLKADLTQPHLGLSLQQYNTLTKQIDTIIHAAALVKHYGEEDIFYAANVKATASLLTFAKLTLHPSFHHISTISVCYINDASTMQQRIYTENDLPSQLSSTKNIYVKTKLYAEQHVIDAEKNGVDVHIYRVGNLALESKRGFIQKNNHEHAFSNYFKYLCKIKCITKTIADVEVSPVDCAARAIIKLFNQNEDCPKNLVYHIFNPYKVNLVAVLQHVLQQNLTTLPIEAFIDQITHYFSQHNQDYPLLLKFLLHLGWLEGHINCHYTQHVQVLQDKTQAVLQSLGFEWRPISFETFSQYFNHLFPQDKLVHMGTA